LRSGRPMSRIGKRPIDIPAKTEVNVSGSTVTVKGPQGTLTKELHPHVAVSVEDNKVVVEPKNDTRLAKALWGTFASHVQNMVKGVNEPYSKKLILDGIGYRMAVSGNTLTLNVGFSHQVDMELPEGISATVEKNELTITGIDKEVVGQFAANVRAVKKPEPYKGKGFHYDDEVVLRKQGKKAV
jgi:large subunit ribosomal protein L6